MVFPSVPFHLDHPTWLQQQNLHPIDVSLIENHQLSMPTVLSNTKDDSTVAIRPCSLLEYARLAKVPYQEAPLKCPRCRSTNTKFCYFNNYSLSQPRHFCKTCRRYWTRGGALREVPIGGGCRRNNKKSKGSTSKSPNITSTASISLNSSNITPPMTNKFLTNSSSYSNLSGFPAMSNVVELQNAGGNEVGFQIGKVSSTAGTLDLSAAFSDQWISPSSNQLNLNQLSCISNWFEQPSGSYNLNPLAYDQVGFVDQSSIMKQEENQRFSNSERFFGNDPY